MAKNLVIVESPAKAKTIEKYLGKDYTVRSSIGHIRDLVKKGLGVDTENNFEPTYEISPDKKAVVKELKDLAKKADVNAIDQTGKTPLDYAVINKKNETADLLRIYGAKAAKELKKSEIAGHEEKAPEGNIDHNNVEKLENELHHLRQEIEDFREAGKLERVKKLKRQEQEVLVAIEKYSNEENKPQIEELDFEERFKTTIEKRREAISKFVELSKALEQLETEENKSEIDIDQLEKKLDEAEYNVEKFTIELERLERLFGG